ncbi:hypothetical protein [Pirellula sp. SH-Sr6A]|uniref:hypothetical protein n=1 Tax=Pirellula sp. SH-Sr6A TaxID=1632865 RepID=UPI00197C728E|nr:hypothetical protein [Pirellula sp. SH-Sr6A]
MSIAEAVLCVVTKVRGHMTVRKQIKRRLSVEHARRMGCQGQVQQVFDDEVNALSRNTVRAFVDRTLLAIGGNRDKSIVKAIESRIEELFAFIHGGGAVDVIFGMDQVPGDIRVRNVLRRMRLMQRRLNVLRSLGNKYHPESLET